MHAIRAFILTRRVIVPDVGAPRVGRPPGRLAVACLALGIAACSPSVAPAGDAVGGREAAAARTTSLPTMTVHKSPTCDCCRRWVEHARTAGYSVAVEHTHQLDRLKEQLGVPREMASCHTAEVGGYVIEGHVPLEDVARLLAERPAVRGLAVPGMPAGSPGMEHPSGQVQPYTVLLIHLDGRQTEYARHGE